MLDRYRIRRPAPAAPEAPATTGAEETAQVRAAPAAPAAPAEIDKGRPTLAANDSDQPPGYLKEGTGFDSDGRPLAPLVRCGGCAHFEPNKVNPLAGCGICQLGEPDEGQRWAHFPGAVRCCPAFEAQQ
jgi:hypothetical protein